MPATLATKREDALTCPVCGGDARECNIEQCTFYLENLGCANCAAKMERKISELPRVEDASVVFATKQLRVSCPHPHHMRETFEELCQGIEPYVFVREVKGRGSGAPASEEPEGCDCGCGGHEHDGHEHEHDNHDHAVDHEHDDHDCAVDHEHGGHDHDGHDREAHQRRAAASQPGGTAPHAHDQGAASHDSIATSHDHDGHGHGHASHDHTDRDRDRGAAAPHPQDAASSHSHGTATPHAASDALTVSGLRLPYRAPLVGALGSVVRVLPERARTWVGKLDAHAQAGLAEIALAAILLVLGLVLEHAGTPFALFAAVFALAYVVAGAPVLAHAVRNFRTGEIFDENLLMSVASLGAFALGEFPEAVGVMLFYRVGEFFEDRAVDKSRDQIMEAVDLRPETVHLLESYVLGSGVGSARTRTAPAEEVQPGDYVLVQPGERIPVDAVVCEGTSRIDTSPITGEPLPLAVRAGSAVTSGCVNGSGALVLRATHALSESMVTRILDSVENAAANKPHMERFITRFARVYTPVVIAVAAFTAIVPSLLTGNWGQWLYTACTFLVISCPCAIVLSVPLSFFAGVGAASKLGILLKGGNSIEALDAVRAVVLDKTGTITKGNFAVTNVEAAAPFTAQDVLAAAASAEANSTHPIAASIASAARKAGLGTAALSQVSEHAGAGVEAVLEGAGDGLQVLCGTRELLAAHGVAGVPLAATAPTGAEDPAAAQASVSAPAAAANPAAAATASAPAAVATIPAGATPASSASARPITTAAGTVVHVAIEGAYAGSIHIADEPKETSADAIRLMRERGLHTAMLTGDAQAAADAVARVCGIDEVHAELLPQQKLDVLRQVREAHGPVMFVGDGINDAPVLAGADVGCAMGSGSDAAIEAADVVFMTSNLGAVCQAKAVARFVLTVARQNIVFALCVKLAVMILGFAGLANMWLAVFADVGVALLCVLNTVRILRKPF